MTTSTETRGYAPVRNVHDYTVIRTNFNPCRQRGLSAAQAAVLRVSELVGVGDLDRIAEASQVDGLIDGCKLGLGYWEPQDDRGCGFDWRLCEERDARTVRITCERGRKPAWLEVTYDRREDAEAVLSAAGAAAERWAAWKGKAEAAA